MENQGEGTGPEFAHQAFRHGRNILNQPLEPALVGNQEEEGFSFFPILDLKNFPERGLARGICRQAVEGLGGKGDDAAPQDDLGRFLNPPGVGFEDWTRHGYRYSLLVIRYWNLNPDRRPPDVNRVSGRLFPRFSFIYFLPYNE